MDVIKWNPNMQVGIPELDTKRETLVEIVNRIDEAMKAEESKDDLASMLQRFAFLTRDYIIVERRYLLLYKSFAKVKNKREDAVEEITRKIIDGLVNYLEGKSCIDEILLHDINKWLCSHLKTTLTLKAYRTRMKLITTDNTTIQGDN